MGRFYIPGLLMQARRRNGMLEWVVMATADTGALPTGISVVTTFKAFHDIYALFKREQQRDSGEMQWKVLNQDLNLWLSKYMIWKIFSANRTLLLTFPDLNRLKRAAFIKKFHRWVHWIQVDIKT